MADYVKARLALLRADIDSQLRFHANRRVPMTNQQPPITPSPELLKYLARSGGYHVAPSWIVDILTASYQAGAQAGADQELEACCEWLAEAKNHGFGYECGKQLSDRFRSARRPKPLNLAEVALEEVQMACRSRDISMVNFDTIRLALERLQKLEGGND